MKILRVKKTPVFDLFVGEGWENWSRYVLKGSSLHFIGGNKLPRLVVERARKEIETWK